VLCNIRTGDVIAAKAVCLHEALQPVAA